MALNYEVWSLIFSFLEPFDYYSMNTGTTENQPLLSSSSSLIIMENIRNWTELRCRSRTIHDGLKFGISRLDLSGLVSLKMINMIQEKISGLVHANSKSSSGLYFKSYVRCSWDDEALMKSDMLIKSELERQDNICELLMDYLHVNFPCLVELNLSGLHRLMQDQLERLGENCVGLKSLILDHCKNIKLLDLGKFKKLERISIHVSQIDLRVNLLDQIYLKEMDKSELIPILNVKGGHTVTTKTIYHLVSPVTLDFSYRTIDLKRIIECSWVADDLKIIFAGKALEDERYLVDYSITHNTTVYIVRKKQ